MYDDFARICDMIGVDLGSYPVRLYGGGTRQAPRIWFSGFASQGDGACFEGRYRYARSSTKTIRAHAPRDAELHRIADTLAAVQRSNFYQLEARVEHHGRYYHEYSMTIDVEKSAPVESAMTDGAEEVVAEALRDLARWLYLQLEAEYAYQTADEQVETPASSTMPTPSHSAIVSAPRSTGFGSKRPVGSVPQLISPSPMDRRRRTGMV